MEYNKEYDLLMEFTKTLGCKVNAPLYRYYLHIALTKKISLSDAVRTALTRYARDWSNSQNVVLNIAETSKDLPHSQNRNLHSESLKANYSAQPLFFMDQSKDALKKYIELLKNAEILASAGFALLILFGLGKK